MTIIGFDVAKDAIVGVRIDRSAQIKEQFVIGNTEPEIQVLIERFVATKRRLVAACEATAEFHVTLAKVCLKRGIPFRLLNPILTKQFTRATVRKKKTDLTDAHIIAKLALQGEGTLVNDNHFLPVKAIARTGHRLIRIQQTVHLMSERYRQHLPDETELREQLDQCLKLLKASAEFFRQRARESVDPAVLRLLQSIPGIGPTIATGLVTEIGEISRFRSGKALVAYVGLDPKVKQSGISLNHNTRITKRGSAHLRKYLFVAAAIAERFDAELTAYYAKKRLEGKRYKEATIAVARKLTYRIYAVWKRGEKYEARPSLPAGA